MRSNIPEKETKILLLKSGGICAFPKCDQGLVVKQNNNCDPVIVGEIAHIIAANRQGPRGKADISPEELNKHSNLILLCQKHHKIIDDNPKIYSVQVLSQMKGDHESHIQKALNQEKEEQSLDLTKEKVHSTLLQITHLPAVVFVAPCKYNNSQENEVKKNILYPQNNMELVPFLLREKKLFTFHDLRSKQNPFINVVDNQNIELFSSVDLWKIDDNKRWYITLLNRALYKYTARLDIQYDPLHHRYYFPVTGRGQEFFVTYCPLNMKTSTRKVAWNPKVKSTGKGKSFWIHLAVGLHFHQMATQQWCLSIRPERYLTSNGITPLPPEIIGKRVTRIKAKMYNDLYLSEVNFWRNYLSKGSPRIILKFGNQDAIIETQLLPFSINWLGVEDDVKPFKNQEYEDDLFTYSDFTKAVAGESIDWDDLEEEAEE